jgi:hypothetical protein
LLAEGGLVTSLQEAAGAWLVVGLVDDRVQSVSTSRAHSNVRNNVFAIPDFAGHTVTENSSSGERVVDLGYQTPTGA